MTGKTLGIILLIGSIIGFVLLALVMFVPMMEGTRSAGAAALGFGLFGVLLLLPLGAGGFLFWRGMQEAEQMGEVRQQRLLLNIVQTRGQVAISDVVLEMKSTRDHVQQMLYDLVGKGLFSGYVVWDEGMLYSEQASKLRELSRCLNCNGELEIGGKGVIRCPYCGTEYFLD